MRSRLSQARPEILSAPALLPDTQQTSRLAQRHPIDDHERAAFDAAAVMNFIAARERHHEVYRMFKADARGRINRAEELKRLTDALAARQAWQHLTRIREPADRHHAEECIETRQDPGLVLRTRAAHENRRLLRGFAAVPRRIVHRVDVGAVELTDAVIREHGPGANGMGARAMAEKTQRQIKAHVVPLVTIIRNSHCY